MLRPATTLVTAAALCAALAPAAHGLDLKAAPDPAAPAGRTPKVVFTITGTVKNRLYKIEATQKSGQNPLNEQGYPVVCTSVVGRFVYTKATGKALSILPTPLTSYELGTGSPCTGIYKGKILVRRGSKPSKVAMKFQLEIPSMRLTHKSIPRG